MATNRWLGHTPAVAQVVTLVVGSNTNTHTFITTINGKSLTVTADGVLTTAQLASAIQALLSASDIPEFREVTWTVDSSTVTGTAATPGVPFTVSKSGTGTYTLTTVTSSSGPSHADATGNWSLGALPGAGDDVLVDGKTADLLYGWDNVSAAAYNSLKIKADFEGNVGLTYWNPAGYVEYRTRAWAIDNGVAVTIGEGDGQGPARVNLNQTTAAGLTVHRTQPRRDPAIPVVNIYGAASGTINAVGGDVAVGGDDPTQAGTITTATVNEGATLTVGPGATVTTVNQNGGTVYGYGTVTTLTQTAGTSTAYVAPTTITCDGGTVWGRFTGTVTTATFRGQGAGPDAARLDFSLDPRARTITNGSFTGGAALWDPDKTTTWSNAQTWDHLSLMNSNLGQRLTLTRT